MSKNKQTKAQMTVYDATYIELATRRQLPLASNDARMKQAAIRSGVDLWQRAASEKCKCGKRRDFPALLRSETRSRSRSELVYF